MKQLRKKEGGGVLAMFCNTTVVFLISISYLTNQYPDPDMLCYGGLSKRWEWFDLFGGNHPSEKEERSSKRARGGVL